MRKIAVAALLSAAAYSTAAHAEPFSGVYGGIEGGIDHYELSADLDITDPDSGVSGNLSLDGLSGNGAVGGVFLGYQVAFPGVFASVEGFGSYSNASMSLSASGTDGTDTMQANIKAEAQGSYGLAARLGTRVNHSTGLYARVGWVNTEFKVSGSCDVIDLCSVSGAYKETEDGIQYGAGLETMIAKKVALRLEYLMTDYGDAGLGDGVSLSNGSARAGLSYRF